MNASQPIQPLDIQASLIQLGEQLDGELMIDAMHRKLYATDASIYQEIPLAVALPRHSQDIQRLIEFANRYRIGLIPRTAGTSLAGQVVGSGIVVDVSRHMNQILEINPSQNYVRVQPGVIRNELNLALAEHGLMFGPETSTANRAMVGGMIGNNSCGSNSIVYGTTRDHLLEVSGFLSDGSEATFKALTLDQFHAKCNTEAGNLENRIYRQLYDRLNNSETIQEIHNRFPKPEIRRRNTGYAVDELIRSQPFSDPPDPSRPAFNICQLIAGSEGTLFFVTEAKLQCVPLPPPVSGLMCIHFNTLSEAMQATRIAMNHRPFGCELIDHFVLQGAARNLQQKKNLDFVVDSPQAILIVEFRGNARSEIHEQTRALHQDLQQSQLGYAYPVLFDADVNKVWELRKSGLGVVQNIPGDTKPIAVIEDTAVALDDLPSYIAELNQTLKIEFGIECVHYAHAGAGEIHLRPSINLKTIEGQRQLKQVAFRVAELVKKYRGSLSGEHGDGRLRSEFLELMVGPQNYRLLKEIKQFFDPHNVFNPNKIIDAPSMNDSLRYQPGSRTPEVKTVFDFSQEHGIVRAAELCNGSGDCRKTHLSGGTMCPSYMATRDEKDTTRARANLLRQVLTDPSDPQNPFNSEELYDALDLCLSCKGCKNECPSNVDLAKLKAEFLQGYYDTHGVPRRTKLIAGFTRSMSLASKFPFLYNAFISFQPTGILMKKFAGFSTKRSLPKLHSQTLRRWFKGHRPHANAGQQGHVVLFCDEFTNYNDVPVGIATVELLERLGYAVLMPDHLESGRTAISKGLLRQAKQIAQTNVKRLAPMVSKNVPLVGIEPSALLTFRDEYLSLVDVDLKSQAQYLSDQSYLVEEFIGRLIDRNDLNSSRFTDQQKVIRLHGHCHQKAISTLAPVVKMLQLPKNYSVKLIPSGCCGMAGSFGYEAEHYDLSMQIGELVLFPTIRKEPKEHLIAASGTSCRHQIADGTGRVAQHPVQILRSAFI